MPEGSQVIAFSRRPWGDAEYRSFIEPSLKDFFQAQVSGFLARVEYVQGTFDDAAAFAALKSKIKTKTVFFHLAIQPEFYEAVVRRLGEAGAQGRLLIEKPFGHNCASAASLERSLAKYFPPKDIFRVDHYLGKEGLDAFLERRRNDRTFEKSLTKESVARVACRLLESLDIEGRGEFYDSMGALKDVGQNHLLEMLAVVLMDIPEKSEEIPRARAAAMESLVAKVSVQGGVAAVRAQYEGYHDDSEVEEGSQTETYFKLELRSATPRWQDVPLLLEAGKALWEKKSDIEITYKDGTRHVFDMDTPGALDAYERVIDAALAGDVSRFASSEEIASAWKLVEALEPEMARTPLRTYAKGSDSAGKFL
jgi:glucose-6-phosphate 1-dehydrogenase